MENIISSREAYLRATALCSKVEKSSGAIIRKLYEWGLEQEEAAIILKKLIDENFVNDERFAKSYVRDKFRFNKWGRLKISSMLSIERICKKYVDAALLEINDEEYRQTLFDILSEKSKSIKAANGFERKGKLFRFAQSRGFESDVIYDILNELLKS